MARWLSPCSARTMTPTEAAWLAGFFDGEGSLSHFMGGRDGRHPTWIITLTNTDFEALDRCFQYTNAGSITDKPLKNRPAHHKPQRQWRVVKQRDLVSVCQQMLPYALTKKAKIEEFLGTWRDIAA